MSGDVEQLREPQHHDSAPAPSVRQADTRPSPMLGATMSRVGSIKASRPVAGGVHFLP